MIRNIHDALNIPAHVLIAEPMAARKVAASKFTAAKKPARPVAATRARSSSATHKA